MTAEDYLRRVDLALRDLPWRMRRELLADLRGHLAEVPSLDELGQPEQYAADLRAAEGLERRRGPIAFLRARRPLYVILSVVALVLIGLAIGAVEWIDSYEPLAFDMGMAYPMGAVEAPAGGSESVVFHKGRPFQLGIDVKNTGRFAVRVLGVSYGPGKMLFSARLVMSKPVNANTIGFAPPFTRFRPFILKPGYAVSLLLKGVYANCQNWNGGSGVEGLSDFPVRFSFLWRTTTAWIPLPEELGIVFPKGFRCR